MEPVLEVKHVSAFYREGKKEQQVLKDIDFTVHKNEILGLVGESGCGKTTLSKAILGFVKVQDGEIIHHTQNPQMIFQDPYSSPQSFKTCGMDPGGASAHAENTKRGAAQESPCHGRKDRAFQRTPETLSP